MNKKVGLPPSKGHDFWVEMIGRYERSEGTQKEFCLRHDLAMSTFTKWLSKIRTVSKKPVSKFRLLEGIELGLFKSKASGVQSSVLEGPLACYEVAFKNGACLRVPGTHSLEALITALV